MYINITSLSCRNKYDDNNRNDIYYLFVHLSYKIKKTEINKTHKM